MQLSQSDVLRYVDLLQAIIITAEHFERWILTDINMCQPTPLKRVRIGTIQLLQCCKCLNPTERLQGAIRVFDLSYSLRFSS